MDNLREKLEKEIDARLDAFDKIPMGTQEDRSAVDSFEKLWRLKLETEEKARKDWAELGLKALSVAVDFGGIVGPLMFYNLWMKRGFEYERDGTFTSGTFRLLQNRFPRIGKR